MTPAEIKSLRKHLRLSQSNFARLLLVSFCTVNRWENAKSKPHPAQIERMARLRKQKLRKGRLQPVLVGVKEAAELFAVKKPNFVRDYMKRPDFPKPLAVLACGAIWLRSDLDGFKEDLERNWL